MRRLTIGVSTALALSLFSGGAALAGGSHPAHIHAGVCPAPGDVIAPLSDVSADFLVDGEMMGGTMGGPGSALVVEASVTTVDVSLSSLLAMEDHAIVVHDVTDPSTYVACGDVGGQLLGSDLPVGLASVGDSTVSGIAWLQDNGDDTTTVSVFLTNSAADPMGDAGMDDEEMDDEEMDDSDG
ncbi:MAG: hypothetical protein ACC726_01540 [Chloroflexota bacterium]